MIYELRIYEVAPNRMPNLHRRFQEVTLRLFEKHGMRVVGFWEPVIGTSNQLIYLMAYEDLNQRQRQWDAFLSDPEWQQAKAESEADGPITVRVVNSILRPTPYSPLQ